MGEIKKVVCFGDSNTHGYNSKTMGRFTEEERWTKLLGKYLGEEYDVVSFLRFVLHQLEARFRFPELHHSHPQNSSQRD